MSIAEAVISAHALLTEDIAVTAERLRRSTVHVRSGRAGSGSGVIWDADGLIVTNAHVAHGSRATVELWDGREFDAEVTATDRRRDLASLSITATDLPAVVVGDSSSLRVGQLVMAVGNPLGLSGALSIGIVHSIAPADDRDRQTWVQGDVRLAPGNSGGPLADVLGRVIGINSMVAGGLGLAVPSNDVLRFLRDAEQRVYLGVTTQMVQARGGIHGLLVLETAAGSPAEAAGLMVGDILVSAGELSFNRPDDLANALFDSGSGSAVPFEIIRGGVAKRIDVLLASGQGSEVVKEAA